MSTRLVSRTWRGDEFLARSRRANGRALVGMGEAAAGAMTREAHVLSGDLRRSIHAAQKDTMGIVPADVAAVPLKRDVYVLEVGSWLPYSCVENSRGGTHRFADIGWQSAEPTFRAKLDRAWREEGL